MSRLTLVESPQEAFWQRDSGSVFGKERVMLEVAHVQNPTVAWARKNGVRCTKLQGPGNRSQPDFIFWIPGGVPLLIEFKRPGQVPTPLQTETIKLFKKADYDVEVHDTKDSAIAAIKQRLDQRATIRECLDYMAANGLPPKEVAK